MATETPMLSAPTGTPLAQDLAQLHAWLGDHDAQRHGNREPDGNSSGHAGHDVNVDRRGLTNRVDDPDHRYVRD